MCPSSLQVDTIACVHIQSMTSNYTRVQTATGGRLRTFEGYSSSKRWLVGPAHSASSSPLLSGRLKPCRNPQNVALPRNSELVGIDNDSRSGECIGGVSVGGPGQTSLFCH